jgi:hypothetical protein
LPTGNTKLLRAIAAQERRQDRHARREARAGGPAPSAGPTAVSVQRRVERWCPCVAWLLEGDLVGATAEPVTCSQRNGLHVPGGPSLCLLRLLPVSCRPLTAKETLSREG